MATIKYKATPIEISKIWWEKATDYFKEQVKEKLDSDEFKNIFKEIVREYLKKEKQEKINIDKINKKPYSFKDDFEDIFLS